MKNAEFLFPELCNLFGDSYNMTYFQRCAPEDVRLIKTNHKSVPAFARERVDLIYIGSMFESKQQIALKALMPYKERIRELIDDDVVFMVTGNAIELFGKKIVDADEHIEALGLFDFTSVRYMDRDWHNSQFVGTYNGLKMIGHRSQFSFSYGEFDHPFIEIEKGIGMNPETKKEGLHIHNFYATYSLGPFLILNPLFTKELLVKTGLPGDLCFEKEILEAYEDRLADLEANMQEDGIFKAERKHN